MERSYKLSIGIHSIHDDNQAFSGRSVIIDPLLVTFIRIMIKRHSSLVNLDRLLAAAAKVASAHRMAKILLLSLVSLNLSLDFLDYGVD